MEFKFTGYIFEDFNKDLSNPKYLMVSCYENNKSDFENSIFKIKNRVNLPVMKTYFGINIKVILKKNIFSYIDNPDIIDVKTWYGKLFNFTIIEKIYKYNNKEGTLFILKDLNIF